MYRMIELLKEMSDEASHIVGTDADNHKEIAIENAKRIEVLATVAIAYAKSVIEKGG